MTQGNGPNLGIVGAVGGVMKRIMPGFFLLLAITMLVLAALYQIKFDDGPRFSTAVAASAAFAAVALALKAHNRLDVLEHRVEHHRQYLDVELSALVTSLPDDVYDRYSMQRGIRRAMDCDHSQHEREFIPEAGMWKCTGCGRGLIGPRHG